MSESTRRPVLSPVKAAELRLCLGKLGHRRLGEAALEWLQVRADGDVLMLVGMCILSCSYPLMDSVIVGDGSDAEALTPHLAGWLAKVTDDGQVTRCELLFRASRDGWDARAFHKLCDGKGATLTVPGARARVRVWGVRGRTVAQRWQGARPIHRLWRRSVPFHAAVSHSRAGADADGADGDDEWAGDVG